MKNILIFFIIFSGSFVHASDNSLDEIKSVCDAFSLTSKNPLQSYEVKEEFIDPNRGTKRNSHCIYKESYLFCEIETDGSKAKYLTEKIGDKYFSYSVLGTFTGSAGTFISPLGFVSILEQNLPYVSFVKTSEGRAILELKPTESQPNLNPVRYELDLLNRVVLSSESYRSDGTASLIFKREYLGKPTVDQSFFTSEKASIQEEQKKRQKMVFKTQLMIILATFLGLLVPWLILIVKILKDTESSKIKTGLGVSISYFLIFVAWNTALVLVARPYFHSIVLRLTNIIDFFPSVQGLLVFAVMIIAFAIFISILPFMMTYRFFKQA